MGKDYEIFCHHEIFCHLCGNYVERDEWTGDPVGCTCKISHPIKNWTGGILRSFPTNHLPIGEI